MEKEIKYKVAYPSRLSSWRNIARKEIYKWLTDEQYQAEICATCMTGEMIGPFTKFLYYFAYKCECGWGVMVDFNEYKQRVFLTNHYYKWMHLIRDKMLEELSVIKN